MSVRTNAAFYAGLFVSAPAEFRLVALCCQWPPDEERNARVDTVTRAPMDWHRVLRLADRHRVAGLVHRALSPCSAVPPETLATLAKQAGRIARSNLMALSHSSRMAERLQTENIPFVILKGAPLSRLAYDDIAIRHSKDIDLLVDPAHVSQVAVLLEEQGFRISPIKEGLTQQQVYLWQKFRKHDEYVHSSSGVRLEVHWRPYDNRRYGSVDLANPRWVDVGGGLRLPTLGAQELYVQLCAHGAGHAWFRLKWIADVAALLRQEEPEAVACLLETARKRDLDRPVEQAMALCAALFPGSPSVPPSKVSIVGHWLALKARTAVLSESTVAPSAEADFVVPGLTRSRLLLRRSWRYRLEEIRIRITSPVDWQTLRLPPWMHFAYPLLRVPLWIKRRWLSRSKPTQGRYEGY